MLRVVLAPDKFKGTLSAAQVAHHLGRGIRSVCPQAELVTVPVADGGDGLLDAFCAVGFERVPVTAVGATGEPRRTSYARRGRQAIVELAEVAGLVQLRAGPAPLTATSRGVGEVLAAVLDAGCTRIVLGIGGSASTDGGAGMVAALGARVLDEGGTEIGRGGGALGAVRALDLAGLHPRLTATQIDVACDVDNPLTGPRGAAAVYGPQKGASPDQVHQLEAALRRWGDVVAAATGRDLRDDPGAGAAGGVGFAAAAILGATLRPGVQLVLEVTGFTDAVAGADLVVTGEGSLDAQTLHGKAPAGVAAAARAAGVRTVAVAGRCEMTPDAQRAAGFAGVDTLVDEAGYDGEAFERPGELLERIGRRLGERLPGAGG